MQANIEQIQKDNILNKLMYFNDEEDEERYNQYYLKQHSKMMYFVYAIVFGVNTSVLIKILNESGFSETALIPITINQILVIIMILLIKKQHNFYNKLSCIINIIFAIEVYQYEMRFTSTDLNDYYQICGFIIYGSHTNLMLSSQLIYDCLGFVINFIIYTFQLSKTDRVIEMLLMWCIIIITIYQKFQHHKFTRFLYVSMQHQQEWIDVIENVLPSAIISIQEGQNSHKLFHHPQNHHHFAKSDILHHTQQIIQTPMIDKPQLQLHPISNNNKDNQQKQNNSQININIPKQKNSSLPLTSLNNAVGSGLNQLNYAGGDGSSGSPQNMNANIDDNLFYGWNLNLVNEQSKEMYSIKDMVSFVNFSRNVIIDTKELVMETSAAINGNISSPLHPLDAIHKQLGQSSNIVNNNMNITVNPYNQNIPSQKITSGQAINQNNLYPEYTNSNYKGPSQNNLPGRYSLQGHTCNNISDLQWNKQRNNLKSNTTTTENVLQMNNHQGQIFSQALSLNADVGSSYVTLYKQLQTLFEEYSYSIKKPKFFIWKLNGKYYPPPQQSKNDEQVSIRENSNLEKNNNNNASTILKDKSVVSIQIKVCGFRGKKTRIILCVEDISISEKIQLYQSQDKYKDLVLANAAHDLRQPLSTLNYTILEAKKLLKKFQSQNIYSFLYQYYPQQFSMLVSANPVLNNLLPNLTVSKINLVDIQALLINSYKQLNVQPTINQDCTELQMISDLLEMADISGNSLKYLINDILDHAKLKEGKLQVNYKECSLVNIIQFTKKMFDFTFKERGIKYRIINKADINSDQICTDQQRLQQVLINLLSNAIKFTPANKYIILHISRVIKNVHNRDVSLLKFSVVDQGCGMSSDQLQQIFKPYVSFNNNNLNIEGIGLGLNICKSIIGLLGPYPKLFVRSKQNEGTKFFFYVYHQLRKGSTTFRTTIQNKTYSKISPTTATKKGVAKIDTDKQNEMIDSGEQIKQMNNHMNAGTTKDVITLKEQQNNHKQNESFELNELNDVVEKNRVMSIIDHTSRSHTRNDFSDNQIQVDNISINQISHPKKNNTNGLKNFDTSFQKQIDNNKKNKHSLEHIDKSIDSEDSYRNQYYEDPDENKDEDEDKNSNLNMTSIIMQLPDFDEGEIDMQEMQSPLTKQSRRNLLQKYNHNGQLQNPISVLNTKRSISQRPTPGSADNLSFLENTFQQQNRNLFRDDSSFLPINNNHAKDIGEIFPDQTILNNNEQNSSNQNNAQYSQQNLLNRQQLSSDNHGQSFSNNSKNGLNLIMQQTENSYAANSQSGNFGLPQSDQIQHNTTNGNMSTFSNINQYKMKHSQFINTNNNNNISNIIVKDDSQIGQSHIISGMKQPFQPNSINSLVSTKVQSVKTNSYVNSVFQPVIPSYVSASIPRHKINNSLPDNHESHKKNSSLSEKRQNKNLPAIITQFQKKYPYAINEMEQSTGSFMINNQKEELQILIADDDAFNLSILKMMLKKSDQFTFQVKDVNNGKESLQEFQKRNNPQSQKPFALIITDINMPIMDGIESTKQMRRFILEQNYHHATFIGISGIDEEQIANDSNLTQDFKIFDVVLSKPLKEQAIINAINQNFLDFY